MSDPLPHPPPWPIRPRPSRPPPRRRGARAVSAVVLGGILFALGLALGDSLDDHPDPATTVTDVRTLRPLPLPPERRTVTVTTRVRRG